MTKYLTIVAATAITAACSMGQFGNVAGDMAKAKITCDGVSGELILTASEAKNFVKDVKNLDKNSDVCRKNQKFCAGLLALDTVDSNKCHIQAAI